MIGGYDAARGRECIHYEWASGGNGAFAEADGPSAMAAIDWGDLSTAQPTEVLESRFPLQVEWSRLGANSGGDGCRRGGLGMRRAICMGAERATYSLLSDGAVLPPFGVLGGGAAAPVDSFVRRDQETIRFPMRAGDVLILQSAGGGGYGDPLERPLTAVATDVREGYITQEHAGEVYGLVLNAVGGVDSRASAIRQQALRAPRLQLSAAATDRTLYSAGKVSRRRICPLNPADMAQLSVRAGDMVKLVGNGGPALRAWT